MGLQQQFCQSLGSSLMAIAIAIAPAWAEQIENWSFDEGKSELTFSLPDDVLPEFFLLAEPPRLVLDIPVTHPGNIQPDQSYDGAVQTIRVAQHSPEQVRVVIELAPDIVLAPEQADIQFDDHDGQRHWRFRPLLGDSNVADTTSSPAVVSRPSPSTSLSAVNLAIPEPSATAAIPVDPYDGSDGRQIISVPPLENEPVIAAEQPVPEIPPMKVPVLEPTDVAVAVSEPVTVTPAVAVSLPDLATEEPAETVAVPTGDLPEDATEPQESVTAIAPSHEVAVSSANSEIEAVLEGSALEESAAVADKESAIVSEPVEAPAVQTETALVVEPAVSDESQPSWPTIQQPAAERTIVQTESPAPLTFGQPLPRGSN